MYHCHLHVYLAGHECRVFEIIKEMPPLENFTHKFTESDEVDASLTAAADVVFINLQHINVKEALNTLYLSGSEDAEFILLTDSRQIGFFEDDLTKIKDVWMLPMSDDEIRFRLLRWQQRCKKDRDFWQTNQYFEATINNIPNLIWYKDKDGVHEKVNDSFCKAVNKTKKQVEGQRHAYIWDVEYDDPACIESENEVMSKQETCVSEELIQTGDGMRTLTTYKSPLYDIDGTVMGTVGVAIDITQERAYEQEIIKKNRTLETIFTTIDCGIIRHTVDGSRIISINRAALKILGYKSADDLKGFDMFAQSVVEEDIPSLRKSLEELKKEGDSVSIEYRVRHDNGEVIHVMGNVRLIEENGELIYQRFLLDCTAQKLEQKKNERRQMELIQALSIDYNFVCAFDLNTGVGVQLRNDDSSNTIVVNPDSHGEIQFQEVMDFYIQNCVFEDDREMMYKESSQEKLKSELAEKENFYVNYRTIVDGETKYSQMKVVRAGNWSETHSVVIGFHSVDEKIKEEMQKKELLENALMRANKASQAKSVFLSNMSHDIRTPMNAIVGFTSLAINKIDDKAHVEEYLNKIMISGNHLLSLINDILDMSHIESGKVQLEENSCNITDILNELRNILQADADAKNLKFNISAENITDKGIVCDKLRLKQVLLNLLSNAVKYTNEGGSVNMEVIETSGMTVGYANYEFHIKDTGIGMSKEFAARIFEPFERERNSTMSKIQGTGLGMAITKNIVDMMNGSIEVCSEQGVGTEFTVSLTFRLCPDVIENTDTSVTKEKKPIHTGRILLAEDVELNQEIAVAILDGAGFKTEVAGNGQIAVEMLKKSEPGYYQLVLMDVQMPVMNGYEATREIRRFSNKKLASIPILAMTANAFEEDKREALKNGMNGHIAKPIDVAVLFDTLEQILA